MFDETKVWEEEQNLNNVLFTNFIQDTTTFGYVEFTFEGNIRVKESVWTGQYKIEVGEINDNYSASGTFTATYAIYNAYLVGGSSGTPMKLKAVLPRVGNYYSGATFNSVGNANKVYMRSKYDTPETQSKVWGLAGTTISLKAYQLNFS